MEKDSGCCYANACYKWEYSFWKQLEEKIEAVYWCRISSIWICIFGQYLSEEAGGKIFVFGRHFAIRTLVEDLEDFEIGLFPCLLEIDRLMSKKFD